MAYSIMSVTIHEKGSNYWRVSQVAKGGQLKRHRSHLGRQGDRLSVRIHTRVRFLFAFYTRVFRVLFAIVLAAAYL